MHAESRFLHTVRRQTALSLSSELLSVDAARGYIDEISYCQRCYCAAIDTIIIVENDECESHFATDVSVGNRLKN